MYSCMSSQFTSAEGALCDEDSLASRLRSAEVGGPSLEVRRFFLYLFFLAGWLPVSLSEVPRRVTG